MRNPQFVRRWNGLSAWQQAPFVGIFCLIIIVLFLATLVGCQGRATFEVNGYYPDHTGSKSVGDPRRPMFEGSGYSEDEGRTTQSSGSQDHFQGRKID